MCGDGLEIANELFRCHQMQTDEVWSLYRAIAGQPASGEALIFAALIEPSFNAFSVKDVVVHFQLRLSAPATGKKNGNSTPLSLNS